MRVVVPNPNRSLFLKQCDALLRVAADERKSLALMLVDVERFRHVNETLGRHTGDILFQRVAQRLETILPASAGIARINADRTIISLAHALGLSVVAEGVETAQQHALLSLLRCNEVQGYLFSRPVPADRVAAILSASGRS